MIFIKHHQKHNRFSFGSKVISLFLSYALVVSPFHAYAQSIAAGLNLPAPGVMVTPSLQFVPPIIRGMTFHPDNPLQFDFLVDEGNNTLQRSDLEKESLKLVKYFMAALTIPEDEQWVNLSPYEENRIIPDSLSRTEMGRDLLTQDYLLKQLTASLIYPEQDLGQEFWSRVYAKAQSSYGTSEIPVDTFNKVWVVPDRATVYEQDNNVLIVENHLKVMLEEDYLSLEHNQVSDAKFKPTQGLFIEQEEVSTIGSQILKEIVLPEIEREVNTGKNFAPLRQIYNSMLLATWYKLTLKESLLNAVYTNQNKLAGIDLNDPAVKDRIYNQYLEAFKVGVYNYIKEDVDPVTKEMTPRKYFSGGTRNNYTAESINRIGPSSSPVTPSMIVLVGQLERVTVEFFGDRESKLAEAIVLQKRNQASSSPIEISDQEKAKYETILSQDRQRHNISISNRTSLAIPYEPNEIRSVYGRDRVWEFTKSALSLASDTTNLRVWHMNTGLGGGVFDLLNAFLAHSAGIEGIEQTYLTMGLDDRMWFTKLIHNAFHGKEIIDGRQVIFTEEMKDTYQEVSKVNAASLIEQIIANQTKAPDFLIIHDPQPLAIMKIMEEEFPDFYKQYFRNTYFLWFGHIPFRNVDVNGSTSKEIWDFFLPYINWYDGIIFHANQKIPTGINRPEAIHINTNSIDPLGLIDIDLSPAALRATREHLKIPSAIERLIMQNARFDRLKDPIGVIEASEHWLSENHDGGLLFTGPLASDDPEGIAVLTEVTIKANEVNQGLGRKAVLIRPFFPMDPEQEIDNIANDNIRMEALEKLKQTIGVLQGLGYRYEDMVPTLSEDMKLAAESEGLHPEMWKPHNILDFILNAMLITAGKDGVIFMKSIEEGFGLAGAGAKWHGLAFLGNTGGLGPQIEHGLNGFKFGIYGISPQEKVTLAMINEKYADVEEQWQLPNSIKEEINKHSPTNRDFSVMEARYFLELVMSPRVERVVLQRIKERARDSILSQYATLRQMKDMLGWFDKTIELSKPEYHPIKSEIMYDNGDRVISSYNPRIQSTVHTLYPSDKTRTISEIQVAGNDTDKTPQEIRQIFNGNQEEPTDSQEEPTASSPIAPGKLNPVGGIDLDPVLLNLQIKRDRNGVPLPKWQQPIQNLNIEGFTPVIINIAPVISVPMYLGQGDGAADEPLYNSLSKDSPFDRRAWMNRKELEKVAYLN